MRLHDGASRAGCFPNSVFPTDETQIHCGVSEFVRTKVFRKIANSFGRNVVSRTGESSDILKDVAGTINRISRSHFSLWKSEVFIASAARINFFAPSGAGRFVLFRVFRGFRGSISAMRSVPPAVAGGSLRQYPPATAGGTDLTITIHETLEIRITLALLQCSSCDSLQMF